MRARNDAVQRDIAIVVLVALNVVASMGIEVVLVVVLSVRGGMDVVRPSSGTARR